MGLPVACVDLDRRHNRGPVKRNCNPMKAIRFRILAFTELRFGRPPYGSR